MAINFLIFPLNFFKLIAYNSIRFVIKTPKKTVLNLYKKHIIVDLFVLL